MPKLPFKPFKASAHYRIQRGKFVLRYRFPEMPKFRWKSSPYQEGRNEKRTFFAWARKFLESGGKIEDDWSPPEVEDALIMTQVDESITLDRAIELYLVACERGTKWMRPKAEATIRSQTKSVLKLFKEKIGGNTELASINGDQIANFIRAMGGKKETKQRRLCSISNLFRWALREKFIRCENPTRDIVFWRERGERPHDGSRKSYTDDEFKQLVEAARCDPLALDGIYLSRYLALRPQDAVELRWEDWKWDQLLVAVRRVKTAETGIEVSFVDIHPVLAERYKHRAGETGYCLAHTGKRGKIEWPEQDALEELVEEKGLTEAAQELGVSYNGLKRRLNAPSSARPNMDRKDLAASLSARVCRLTREAGLYEKGIQPLYVLRHSFASDSLLRGESPARVAQEMGISVETLMKHYFHAIPRGELDNRQVNRWGLERIALSRP